MYRKDNSTNTPTIGNHVTKTFHLQTKFPPFRSIDFVRCSHSALRPSCYHFYTFLQLYTPFTSTSTLTRNVVSSRRFLLTLSSRVCFPKATSGGMLANYHIPGHYRALEWQEKAQTYELQPELGIVVGVEVCGTCIFVDDRVHNRPLAVGNGDWTHCRTDPRTTRRPFHLHLARIW